MRGRGHRRLCPILASLYDQPTDASPGSIFPNSSAQAFARALRRRTCRRPCQPPRRPTPPGLIRDAETEALIRTYAKPIFDAAGLGSQAIDIHIVNDRSFNAFVVDGHNMFIHAGTLMDAKTPESGDRRHRA